METTRPPEEISSMLRKQIGDARHKLSAVELQVLQLRLGLEDGLSWTLEEVAQECRITREDVREIEATAFRKQPTYGHEKRAQSLDRMQKLIDDARNRLSAVEVVVLQLMLCSEDGRSRTVEEVASHLGRSQDEIQQTFSAALPKLFPHGPTEYGLH